MRIKIYRRFWDIKKNRTKYWYKCLILVFRKKSISYNDNTYVSSSSEDKIKQIIKSKKDVVDGRVVIEG